MSEASMIVPDADRYTVRSPILLINTCKCKTLLKDYSKYFRGGIFIQGSSGYKIDKKYKSRYLRRKGIDLNKY